MSQQTSISGEVSTASGPGGSTVTTGTRAEVSGRNDAGGAGIWSSQSSTTGGGRTTSSSAMGIQGSVNVGSGSVGLNASQSTTGGANFSNTTNTFGASADFGGTSLSASTSRDTSGVSTLGGKIGQTFNLSPSVTAGGTFGKTITTGEGFRTDGTSFGLHSTYTSSGGASTTLSGDLNRSSGTFGPTSDRSVTLSTEIPVSRGGFVTGFATTGSGSSGGRSYSRSGGGIGVGCRF